MIEVLVLTCSKSTSVPRVAKPRESRRHEPLERRGRGDNDEAVRLDGGAPGPSAARPPQRVVVQAGHRLHHAVHRQTPPCNQKQTFTNGRRGVTHTRGVDLYSKPIHAGQSGQSTLRKTSSLA